MANKAFHAASIDPAILRLEDASVRFGGLVALSDVSMHIDAGEVVGLIGPNGAGKSTLVNVLTGLVTPTSGRILWDAQPLKRRFVGKRRVKAVLGVALFACVFALFCAGPMALFRAAAIEPMAEANRIILQHNHASDASSAYDNAQRVTVSYSEVFQAASRFVQTHLSANHAAFGLFLGTCFAWALLRLTARDPALMAQQGIVRTFQNLRLFSGLTVAEHLAVALRPSEPLDATYIAELLAQVGLAGLEDTQASALAYGQMRRLEIARALARKPRLLLLDEPAAGLGAQETQLLVELLAGLRSQGVAVLLIEHDMDLVMRVCDRLVVLEYGRKIADGTPHVVQKNPEVIRAYLGTAASALASHAHGVGG